MRTDAAACWLKNLCTFLLFEHQEDEEGDSAEFERKNILLLDQKKLWGGQSIAKAEKEIKSAVLFLASVKRGFSIIATESVVQIALCQAMAGLCYC